MAFDYACIWRSQMIPLSLSRSPLRRVLRHLLLHGCIIPAASCFHLFPGRRPCQESAIVERRQQQHRAAAGVCGGARGAAVHVIRGHARVLGARDRVRGIKIGLVSRGPCTQPS